MPEDAVFEALIDACVAAGEVLMAHGTCETRDAVRALPFTLAREIAAQRNGNPLSDEA